MHHQIHTHSLVKHNTNKNALVEVECKELGGIQKFEMHAGDGIKIEWEKGSKSIIRYTTSIIMHNNNDGILNSCHDHLIANSDDDLDPFELRYSRTE